jgi:mannosyltransferase
VWLTVVLVIAATRRGSALWALYGLVLALAIVCFVYLALLVFAHAVTLALSWKRRQLLPFAIAVAVGLSLASPLIALTAGQRQHQLWWINEGGYLTGVFWEQWLTGSRLFLCASVILLVWGSVVLVTRKVSAGEALAVAVPWVVVPTALLVGYSALVSDIYHPRYLTYTGPGLGLLLGVCVAAIARNRSRILAVLLAVLALSSSTAFVTQRSVYGKPGGRLFGNGPRHQSQFPGRMTVSSSASPTMNLCGRLPPPAPTFSITSTMSQPVSRVRMRPSCGRKIFHSTATR